MTAATAAASSTRRWLREEHPISALKTVELPSRHIRSVGLLQDRQPSSSSRRVSFAETRRGYQSRHRRAGVSR